MQSKPFRVTLETNPDQCNLKCVFCQEHSPLAVPQLRNDRAQRLDFGIVRQVFDDLGASLQEVAASTMGEPLLYQHIDALIQLCAERDVRLNLTTNGTFPRKGPERWARQLIHVASDVKISVNAADPDVQAAVMVGSQLDSVIDNIRRFLEVRNEHLRSEPASRVCSVTLKVVFMEANLNQLPDIVALAAELGVDRVRGHHLLPLFPELLLQDLNRNHDSRQRWQKVAEVCHRHARRPDGSSVRLDNFEPLTERTTRGPCPFLGKEAFIDARGRLVPCCVPKELLVQLGDFGHLSGHGIVDLWNGRGYRHFVERMHPVCEQCELRLEKS